MTELEIRPLTVADAEACDRIVEGLPYHFGNEQGRIDCAAAVRRDDGLVAVRDGEVAGFLTFVPRFEEAAEITWMAVRADTRRRGIGHALLERLGADLLEEGRRILIALTVSPNDPDPTPEPDDGYGATRAFYAANGFVLSRDLPREWTGDLAVMLVKVLTSPVRSAASPGPPSRSP